MPDEPQPAPAVTPSGPSIQAQGDVNVGGDVVGRDKITNVTNVFNLGAAQAGAGLAALTDILQRSTEARTAATAFQTDFQAAYQQIDLISEYKFLHDLLHRLQFQCYNSLTLAAPSFPDDDLAVEQLKDARLVLEGLIDEARQAAGRAKVAAADIAWVTDLDSAKTDLAAALDGNDAKPLSKVPWRLNRLLNQYPARINTSLIQSARTLRLPALVGALQQLAASLTQFNVEQEKIDQFQLGVEALGFVDSELNRQITEHDQWQVVEQDLRLLDSTVDRGEVAELQLGWPDLKQKAEPLYAGSEEWALNLHKDSAGVDETLAANNPAKLKRAYRSYRRRAGERFFRVDKDLRELCERLRDVGAPLASVTRLIQ